VCPSKSNLLSPERPALHKIIRLSTNHQICHRFSEETDGHIFVSEIIKHLSSIPPLMGSLIKFVRENFAPSTFSPWCWLCLGVGYVFSPWCWLCFFKNISISGADIRWHTPEPEYHWGKCDNLEECPWKTRDIQSADKSYTSRSELENMMAWASYQGGYSCKSRRHHLWMLQYVIHDIYLVYVGEIAVNNTWKFLMSWKSGNCQMNWNLCNGSSQRLSTLNIPKIILFWDIVYCF
jgi:hypothetical protein